ncbi:MAG: lipopolysaccharide biosynthesis protein [Ilumatobacteraceae bacterium]
MTAVLGSDSAVTEAPLMSRVRALAMGQTLVKVCYIAIAFVLVRSLTSGVWNEVALGLSIYMVATVATTLSLEQSIVYQVPLQTRIAALGFARRTLVTLSGLGVVSSLVLFLIEWRFAVVGFPTMVAVALTVLVDAPLAMVSPWLIVNQRERAAGWWMGSSALLMFCGVVCASLPSGATTRTIFFGMAIAAFVRLPVALRLLWPVIAHSSSERATITLRLQLGFCVPLALALTGGVLTRAIDKWMVAVFDPTALGSYVIAAQEIPLLSVLPYAGATAIAASLSRKLAHGRVEDAFDEWSQQVIAMIDVVVPITLALVVIGPELLRVMSGKSSSTAAVAFQLFTLIGLHRVTEYGAVLRAAGRSADVIKASLVLLVLNGVLAGTGGAIAGMVGVTIGSLCAFVVAWIFALHLLGRVLSKSIGEVFPWLIWMRAIATYSPPMVAVYAFTASIGDWTTRLGIKCLLLVVVVVGLRTIERGSIESAPTPMGRNES